MSLAPIRESEDKIKEPHTLSMTPDFILIRNQVRGPKPGGDFRNVLFGLMAGHVPAVNSLESVYMNLERPIMFAALKSIQLRLGRDRFPLISQNFYSISDGMVISPDLPCIVKVSHAHAGMGKTMIGDQQGWRDLATVLALHEDYCTAETFIKAEYGIRIQKTGPTYRVYKKHFTGSGWKSQFGGSHLETIPLTDEYKLWADECAKLFGGMDIFALDCLHGEDGKDYVIELNDCAIGILSSVWEEDSMTIAQLVIDKMNEIYCAVLKEEVTKKQKEKKKKSKGLKKKPRRTITRTETKNSSSLLSLSLFF